MISEIIAGYVKTGAPPGEGMMYHLRTDSEINERFLLRAKRVRKVNNAFKIYNPLVNIYKQTQDMRFIEAARMLEKKFEYIGQNYSDGVWLKKPTR